MLFLHVLLFCYNLDYGLSFLRRMESMFTAHKKGCCRSLVWDHREWESPLSLSKVEGETIREAPRAPKGRGGLKEKW
jgi:hypothetical protein